MRKLTHGEMKGLTRRGQHRGVSLLGLRVPGKHCPEGQVAVQDHRAGVWGQSPAQVCATLRSGGAGTAGRPRGLGGQWRCPLGVLVKVAQMTALG